MGDCSVDGIDLHIGWCWGGWALSAEPDAKGRYKGDEDDARAGRFGLWKGRFVAPAEFRGWNRRSAKLLGPGCPADARDNLFPDETPMPAGAIKGHYATRAWPSKGIYHLPECGSYGRTKAKRWFCTEEMRWRRGFARHIRAAGGERRGPIGSALDRVKSAGGWGSLMFTGRFRRSVSTSRVCEICSFAHAHGRSRRGPGTHVDRAPLEPTKWNPGLCSRGADAKFGESQRSPVSS